MYTNGLLHGGSKLYEVLRYAILVCYTDYTLIYIYIYT